MNAIGYLNSSGSSSVRIRLASVWMSSAVSSWRIARQVLLGARVVVVPRRAESTAAREAQVGLPAQSDEREPAVVDALRLPGNRAAGGPLPSASRVELQGSNHGGTEDDNRGGDSQPPAHGAIIPEASAHLARTVAHERNLYGAASSQ